ncbi:DUF2256 domain-containing protein [Thalassospira sp. CH_XMU1448-2]|uniref:DUF2256 domain-containing protein n=1 Tax=Thalassospira sp. CH_XMU1448-2 TaxID=3107773 RepID=UPI00300BDEA7
MPRNANGKFHGKSHLPEKICVTCNRPFSWRRKWKDCWDEVCYCSDRCRQNRNMPTSRDKQSSLS